MMLKIDILNATHYGLGIYAHILRVYYPNETVLHLVGRDCGLCRNPFANGESNLHIWIEKSNPDDPTSDECARHHDTSGTILDGDAFTFAEQHYHLTGDDLPPSSVPPSPAPCPTSPSPCLMPTSTSSASPLRSAPPTSVPSTTKPKRSASNRTASTIAASLAYSPSATPTPSFSTRA